MTARDRPEPSKGCNAEPSFAEAQAILEDLASAFAASFPEGPRPGGPAVASPETQLSNFQATYRTLVEQIPAVVFMVYLDGGAGEAYVSPHIEATLGYSQAEWLEDPVRWYRQIHPEDNLRWSVEAAEMFLTGKPLRSVYRMIARDGHVVWFHCEAKMVRRKDGRPWFIQGVAMDITDLKQAEAALEEERNFISMILNTVGTLIIVLDRGGRVVHFNRPCEQATGHRYSEVRGRYMWDLFGGAAERERFRSTFEQLVSGRLPGSFESYSVTQDRGARLISWSGSIVPDANGNIRHVIVGGIDITDSKRLEKAVLEISEREQRRIGQDLHDGLGQHLTGIAFMSKVLEQKLAEKSLDEAGDAAKIVRLVNDAINRTRELSRGLLPVVSDSRGLMSALEHWTAEVEDLFGVSCRFHCDDPVLIYDDKVATQLYHIAREAVNNAIKHGRAKHIVVSLGQAGDHFALTVGDDGRGLPEELGSSPGMGLHIMNYRAKMIGGTLRIQPSPGGGTTVTCPFPSSPGTESEGSR